MMKIRSFLVLSFLWVSIAAGSQENQLPTTSPGNVGLSGKRLERLDAMLQEKAERKEVAGGVALIVRAGKAGYLNAFGMADIEDGKPMQPDSLFRIASMTKAITSLGVLMLHEEGKFLLTDPVSKYIPEFKNPQVLVPNPEGSAEPYKLIPAKREITIRDLLTHTSGLAYTFSGMKYVPDLYIKENLGIGIHVCEGTVGEMVKKLAKLPLAAQPGEEFIYGLNIDVLGYLIEVTSGMPLDKFFHERIFKPLGMSDTAFFIDDDQVSRLASVYEPTPDGGLKKLPNENIRQGNLVYSAHYPYSGPKSFFSGGGGLISTAEDYAKFLQMTLNGGQLNGNRIVSRKTVELMTTGHVYGLKNPYDAFSPGSNFGYGFAVMEDSGPYGLLGSEGMYEWGGFFNTMYWVDSKEELVAVLMTQLYPSGNTDIKEKFRTLVYQAIAD